MEYVILKNVEPSGVKRKNDLQPKLEETISPCKIFYLRKCFSPSSSSETTENDGLYSYRQLYQYTFCIPQNGLISVFFYPKSLTIDLLNFKTLPLHPPRLTTLVRQIDREEPPQCRRYYLPVLGYIRCAWIFKIRASFSSAIFFFFNFDNLNPCLAQIYVLKS